LNAQAEKAGLGHGKLNQPLRAAITGTGIGAGIYETAEILGREKTLARMATARQYYPKQ
jgi:glutamyl/glutaminyl-tRNA synthetase